MGKRSNFKRKPRDYYPTPIEAVAPLIDHLPLTFDYIEPCAGDYRLAEHIGVLTNGHGKCLYACDIEPKDPRVFHNNALELDVGGRGITDFIITNPPWDREFLHPFIVKAMDTAPTWLLFDADWMHTKQSAILMTYCKKIVSVGRVKWIEGSKNTGKDNCCWYLFDIGGRGLNTEFYGRTTYEKSDV